MDWRAGHLITAEGTGGGAFANKNFKCPVYDRGLARRGMLAAGIDSHITLADSREGLLLEILPYLANGYRSIW